VQLDGGELAEECGAGGDIAALALTTLTNAASKLPEMLPVKM
jgi:hypothetical protein